MKKIILSFVVILFLIASCECSKDKCNSKAQKSDVETTENAETPDMKTDDKR